MIKKLLFIIFIFFKKGNYFQKQLGLDAKTPETIKILMDEGLLNYIEKRRKRRD